MDTNRSWEVEVTRLSDRLIVGGEGEDVSGDSRVFGKWAGLY